MTFDIQAPGFSDLLVFPAGIVLIAGLLLRRRFRAWVAALIAMFLPGILALLLTAIDERAWDRLEWAPVGWVIWTMLTLPGALIGLLLLVIVWKLQALRRSGGT